MIRLFSPAGVPAWVQPLIQSIERVIRDATKLGTVVTYTSGSIADDVSLLLVSASAGAVTITLPPVNEQKHRVLTIKKTDSTANAVTIDANGSETIDGALTTSLTTQWQSRTLQCDGAAWFLI